jgi:hypothetical protein
MKTYLIILMVLILSGCQYAARELGGTYEVTLPVNQKLEMVTWKDDSLWYLTRDRKPNETPETHTFKESSITGALQGKVIIREQ